MPQPTCLTHFWPNPPESPTIALEAMGYVPPLDIVLEGEALKSWLRIKNVRTADVWDGVGNNKLRGHRLALQKLLASYEIPEVVQDPMPRQPKWTRHF